MIDSVSLTSRSTIPPRTNHIPYGNFVPNATVNSAGVLTNNFYSQYPVPRPWKRYFGRLDYAITQNNRLTLSDTQGDESENGANPVTFARSAARSATSTITTRRSPTSGISARVPSTKPGSVTPTNSISSQDAGTNLGYPGKLGWQYAKADVLPPSNSNAIIPMLGLNQPPTRNTRNSYSILPTSSP